MSGHGVHNFSLGRLNDLLVVISLVRRVRIGCVCVWVCARGGDTWQASHALLRDGIINSENNYAIFWSANVEYKLTTRDGIPSVI